MKQILIVVDMQKDFVDGALGTKEATQIVDAVVNKIKSFDGDIYVTFDTHGEDYMQTSEGKKLPVPHCIKGTDGWSLDEKVCLVLRDKVYTAVEKPTFGSVELPELLKKNYGEEPLSIELLGLCTDICVISNAMIAKAFLPEVKIIVDAACCAGVSPETHKNALSAMKVCQITVENEE